MGGNNSDAPQKNTGSDDDSTVLSQLTTIPRRLKYFSEVHPERELFVIYSPGRREACTAGRLLKLAGKFAGHLVKEGFKPGDILANSLPNSLERLVTDLGAIMAGCASMNAPFLFQDGYDFFSQVERSGCKAVILCPEKWSAAWRLLGSSITHETDRIFCPLSCEKAKDLTTAVLVRSRRVDRSFLSVLEESDVKAPDLDLSRSEHIVCIATSSGTTGVPKMVARTHAEVLGPLAECFPMDLDGKFTSTRDVVLYSDRSLGWVTGVPANTYAYGDTRVLQDEMSSTDAETCAAEMAPSELYDVIIREGCNIGLLLHRELRGLAQHVQAFNLPSKFFKSIQTGGSPIHKMVCDMAFSIADTVIITYGTSETGCVSKFILKDESEYQAHCCGQPVPGIELCVVDDAGKTCAPGVVGDILIKAPHIFTNGYFNVKQNPDPDTAKTMRPGGWVDIGDHGYFGTDGNLFVLGRKKDVIFLNGVTFYPATIESKLFEHPDIIDAVVVTVTDPFMEHDICACVKIKEGSQVTADDLDKYCCSIFEVNNLSTCPAPVPKYYLILRGAEFPYQNTGKANRRKLGEIAEKLFGKGTGRA